MAILGLRTKESRSIIIIIDFPSAVYFLIELIFAIAFSVLDIGVMYLWPWV